MNMFVSGKLRLAYRVDGPDNAPALVLVNSLGTDLRMWDSQIPLLSRSLRVIRFDYRGHGGSDAPPGPYSIEQLGRDLLALLDTLQIARVHLCGLSLGGLIAMWFASCFPERVMSAIFANTAVRIGTSELWDARIDEIKKGGMAAVRDAVLARFLSPGFRQRNPVVAQQIGEMIEATNPVGYIGACACLRDTDLRERLTTIHVPSLLLAGALDEATPVSQTQELLSVLPSSELVVLHQAAHLSNVEQPEDFGQSILHFLAHQRDA